MKSSNRPARSTRSNIASYNESDDNDEQNESEEPNQFTSNTQSPNLNSNPRSNAPQVIRSTTPSVKINSFSIVLRSENPIDYTNFSYDSINSHETTSVPSVNPNNPINIEHIDSFEQSQINLADESMLIQSKIESVRESTLPTPSDLTEINHIEQTVKLEEGSHYIPSYPQTPAPKRRGRPPGSGTKKKLPESKKNDGIVKSTPKKIAAKQTLLNNAMMIKGDKQTTADSTDEEFRMDVEEENVSDEALEQSESEAEVRSSSRKTSVKPTRSNARDTLRGMRMFKEEENHSSFSTPRRSSSLTQSQRSTPLSSQMNRFDRKTKNARQWGPSASDPKMYIPPFLDFLPLEYHDVLQNLDNFSWYNPKMVHVEPISQASNPLTIKFNQTKTTSAHASTDFSEVRLELGMAVKIPKCDDGYVCNVGGSIWAGDWFHIFEDAKVRNYILVGGTNDNQTKILIDPLPPKEPSKSLDEPHRLSLIEFDLDNSKNQANLICYISHTFGACWSIACQTLNRIKGMVNDELLCLAAIVFGDGKFRIIELPNITKNETMQTNIDAPLMFKITKALVFFELNESMIQSRAWKVQWKHLHMITVVCVDGTLIQLDFNNILKNKIKTQISQSNPNNQYIYLKLNNMSNSIENIHVTPNPLISTRVESASQLPNHSDLSLRQEPIITSNEKVHSGPIWDLDSILLPTYIGTSISNRTYPLYLTTSYDGKIKLFNPRFRNMLTIIQFPGPLSTCKWFGTGEYLLFTDVEYGVRLKQFSLCSKNLVFGLNNLGVSKNDSSLQNKEIRFLIPEKEESETPSERIDDADMEANEKTNEDSRSIYLMSHDDWIWSIDSSNFHEAIISASADGTIKMSNISALTLHTQLLKCSPKQLTLLTSILDDPNFISTKKYNSLETRKINLKSNSHAKLLKKPFDETHIDHTNQIVKWSKSPFTATWLFAGDNYGRLWILNSDRDV